MPLPGPVRDALGSIRAVAGNPGLLRLNIGWAGSISGEYLALTALGVFAFGAGGASGVGLIAAAQMLPVLLAPFAAALGDRFRRERVMALTDLIRAMTALLAAAAVIGGAGAWVVYLLAASSARAGPPSIRRRPA